MDSNGYEVISIGTSHFKSKRAAVDFYQPYYPHYTATEVARVVMQKIKADEISLGPPKGRKGWDLTITSDGLYRYEKQKPKAKKCSTPDWEVPF